VVKTFRILSSGFWNVQYLNCYFQPWNYTIAFEDIMLLFNYNLVTIEHSFSLTLNPCTPQLLVTTKSMSVASFILHSALQFHSCCHKWETSFFIVIFSSTWIWTHGPMLASQGLYHFHHAFSSRFCSLYVWLPSPLYITTFYWFIHQMMET
jgi:hypothetical protein